MIAVHPFSLAIVSKLGSPCACYALRVIQQSCGPFFTQLWPLPSLVWTIVEIFTYYLTFFHETKRGLSIDHLPTSVSTGRPGTNGTSRCPFVPGQKNFLVPVSLCPGTRAGAKIPGQTPLSQDFPEQNHFPEHKKQEKDVPKQEKYILKQKRTF